MSTVTATNTESTPLYTFQVLAGEHQGNRQKYVKGDIFRSQYELDKMFVEKFQRLPNSPAMNDDTNAQQSKRVKKEQPPFNFTDATNVSHMFPSVKTAGLSIFKDSTGGYAVAVADAKVPMNIAGEIFDTKAKVAAYLKDFETSDAPD